VDISVKSDEGMQECSPLLKQGTFCISDWNLCPSTRQNQYLRVLSIEKKCKKATIPEKLILSITQLQDVGSFLKS
jgi:hypothetical protein